MLKSKLKWKFNNRQADESARIVDDSIKISPVIQELLYQRGIKSVTAAKQFLQPNIANLHDPGDITAIEKAGSRIHKAIEDQEKILVFGDYDADGVSSTTLLLKTLQELGANCDYYIPNRFTEGYGPNEQAFREVYENGFTLIITVDTGIASVNEATLAKELGIDLIITDHHEPQEVLPDAFAIIHPKLSPAYPFADLAGVGVAFKLAHYLLGYFPEHLLDLVAIGTIADMVPLIDENRVLAYNGLRQLANTKREGIKALKRQCGIDGQVTEDDIGFSIAPRLNAVGRLQDADLAVQLLMSEEQTEADQLAEMVQELNEERKQIVANIVSEAEKMVASDMPDGVIVVAKKGWNEGVLGIVASRLVQKYDRPAIVLAINEEKSIAKGSARSIPAFDLFKNCMMQRDLFTHFGGHSQAAGMTLPIQNVSELASSLSNQITAQLTADDFKQDVEISKTLSLTEIDESLVNELASLAPFGMGNPKPIFHIEQIPDDVRQLGSMKKHLKLLFKQESKQLEGIGFGMGEKEAFITPNTTVSIVGEIGINEWNGYKKVQLVFKDIRIDSWQLFDHRGKRDFDFAPYLDKDEKAIMLCNQIDEKININWPNLTQITYNSQCSEVICEADTLFLFDLPVDLTQFKQMIGQIKPVNIHVCLNIENSVYLQPFPSREDFKWYYALLWKRKTLDLNKEAKLIIDAKNWTKDNIIFMTKVFFELEFVKIENGIIYLQQTPIKKDLQSSLLYQQRIQRYEMEKTLYYSTYEELKRWFYSNMPYLHSVKEEAVHGLEKIY